MTWGTFVSNMSSICIQAKSNDVYVCIAGTSDDRVMMIVSDLVFGHGTICARWGKVMMNGDKPLPRRAHKMPGTGSHTLPIFNLSIFTPEETLQVSTRLVVMEVQCVIRPRKCCTRFTWFYLSTTRHGRTIDDMLSSGDWDTQSHNYYSTAAPVVMLSQNLLVCVFEKRHRAKRTVRSDGLVLGLTTSPVDRSFVHSCREQQRM